MSRKLQDSTSETCNSNCSSPTESFYVSLIGNYTLASLAIALTEMALRKPIDVLRTEVGCPTTLSEQFQVDMENIATVRILAKPEERICEAVNDTYAEIVDRCARANFQYERRDAMNCRTKSKFDSLKDEALVAAVHNDVFEKLNTNAALATVGELSKGKSPASALVPSDSLLVC